MSLLETASVLIGAGGPLLAKGIIVRRPWVVRLLQATAAEQVAVRLLQAIRRRHGTGPVMMRLAGRKQAVLLAPEDVERVLAQTPEPFETDSSEKHATLAHFQPRGSLISRGHDRAERRVLNEAALESACPVHSSAPRIRGVIEEEALALMRSGDADATLAWGAFKDGWFRVVRRCLFGDGAADDTDLTAMLMRLRSDANWAFLHPKRRTLRARFLSRVASYLHSAEPGTLAERLSRLATSRAAAEDQVGQWLFAFDAAGIATYRALAVLASSAAVMDRAVRDERPNRPFLRACLLESVRLWPTTPAILRQTDRETEWSGGKMPTGTGLLIHVPFLHRDDERLPFANRFAPEIWLGNDSARWSLIPFSAGPAECPAKNLVLLIASEMLGLLIATRRFQWSTGQGLDLAALPPTFDQFSVSLAMNRTSDI